MTFEQLRIFLAVAARSHVTQAASALNLTQSAVSSAIATLEAQHGVKLFDRIGRGIVLTEEGRLFLPVAQRVLTEAETARNALDDLAAEPRGTLRVFASQTVASYWLPPRLMALHARHAGLRIALTVGNSTQAAKAVSEGTADLGFVEGPLPESDLQHQVVARDELVLVMRDTRSMAGCESFSTDDYRAFTWVLRETGSGTRSESETHLSGMGLSVDQLDVALELPSNEAVLAAIAASDAVSLVSHRALRHSAFGHVRGHRITWTAPSLRPFAMITHPHRHRTRAASALITVISEMRGDAGSTSELPRS
ncbi:LysR substrate-binding domain-containing protein [Celeribacter persicus]|nr:LysR substrate-binding domain-containing protein [Celeribacter persicus]